MMRGRIKGTDSTINAILATAVLYELRWNCVGKIQFTNTVEFTEWSELLNHATNLLRHHIRSYTTGNLELGCGIEP